MTFKSRKSKKKKKDKLKLTIEHKASIEEEDKLLRTLPLNPPKRKASPRGRNPNLRIDSTNLINRKKRRDA